MTNKNPYRKSASFWIKLTKKIITYYCEDLTATQTANLLKIRRSTINDWYNYIREVIYQYCEKEKQEVLKWEIELDESYFWPTRVRWKRWRWAGMKTIVFGLLKRNGKVYSEIVPDCKSDTLRQIIRWKISEESVIHTDWWRWYNGLVDIWFNKHYRVHHWENEFARGNQHINWIESFWSFCKRRLNQFNWIPRHKFALHLKECEFRFNCWLQNKNMYKCLLKILLDFNKPF